MGNSQEPQDFNISVMPSSLTPVHVAKAAEGLNLYDTASHQVSHFVPLKPGDLLYAIVDVGVNSDVPSAVLATVTSGAYRNTRLMGTFQRHEERLVLAFNRAVLPTGETVQLEAYAGSLGSQLREYPFFLTMGRACRVRVPGRSGHGQTL